MRPNLLSRHCIRCAAQLINPDKDAEDLGGCCNSAQVKRPVCPAGAGSGVPHQFSYPDKAAENMAVLQYANADAGAEGTAQLVLEAASAAVKVLPRCALQGRRSRAHSL